MHSHLAMTITATLSLSLSLLVCVLSFVFGEESCVLSDVNLRTGDLVNWGLLVHCNRCLVPDEWLMVNDVVSLSLAPRVTM